MSEPIAPTPPHDDDESRLKIYFLPNLLTAGNLFCGFVALTKIVDANLVPDAAGYVNWMPIKLALAFILLACIFDLFDGRVARMGGVESPFGREFDSLADLVSFGVAPAFLVQRVVLADVFPANTTESAGSSPRFICSAARSGWRGSIASPRCTTPSGGKDFLGFPIPSAAGLVASLTLLIIHFNEKEKSLGNWNYLIAVVLVFLSAMMVSTVRYPSFKSLGPALTSTFMKAIGAALFVGCILTLREKDSLLRLAGVFHRFISFTVSCVPASRARGGVKLRRRTTMSRARRIENV